jgi:nucleoside 2-deoxyribosyltransferase
VKAYISGALMNAGDLAAARARYERIADACAAAGWDAYVPHQHADPERDPGMTNREVADRDLAQVAGADVVVAYVGEPSLGVGAEVAIALAAGKGVLLAAERQCRVSRFLLGLAERSPDRAAILRYDHEDGLRAWIIERLRARSTAVGHNARNTQTD